MALLIERPRRLNTFPWGHRMLSSRYLRKIIKNNKKNYYFKTFSNSASFKHIKQ